MWVDGKVVRVFCYILQFIEQNPASGFSGLPQAAGINPLFSRQSATGFCRLWPKLWNSQTWWSLSHYTTR
jgi:hypothetical protein